MTDLILRELTPDEVDAGYAVYSDAFDWLNRRGIRQWLEPRLPRTVYRRQQKQGRNFGLFRNRELAAIVCLTKTVSPAWRKELGDSRRWWLTTLAVARKFTGQQLGRETVSRTLTHLRDRGVAEVYLDCVSDTGFLLTYYQESGFTLLAEKTLRYPSGTFPMVLLSRRLI